MGEQLSVVIPTFNEESRIGKTLLAISAYLQPRFRSFEIVVADDGSTDGTRDIVSALLKAAFRCMLLPSKENKGKGNAVRRGVSASTGDLILITDADLATPVEELEKLHKHVASGADIAVGSRGLTDSLITAHQSPYREMLGKLFNRLVQLAILPGIWDSQCGFKLFRGSVARSIFADCVIDGFAFDVEVLALAARAGFRIVEVPVRWAHQNQSKVRLLQDSMRMLRDVARIAANLRSGRYPLPERPLVHEERPVALEEPLTVIRESRFRSGS